MDTRPWSRLPETWAETSAASVRQHGARVVDYPTPRVRDARQLVTPVRQIHPATVAIVLPSGALPSPLDAIHESAMRGG